MNASPRITTLIVDDEPLARKTVRRLLATDPQIEIVGECGDGWSALKALQELKPQLVYLDIRMPGLSGISVLDRILPRDRPSVIFATAYDEFAVRAFELLAIDYLLKPFTDDRFLQSLSRAKSRATAPDLATVAQEIDALIARFGAGPAANTAAAAAAKPVPPAPFLLKTGHDRLLLNPQEIRWIEGQSDYARVHLPKGSVLVRRTLTSLAAQLAGNFVRIHKSTIVNLDYVTRIRARTSGDWVVELNDGTQVRASRNHRQRLKERLG